MKRLLALALVPATCAALAVPALAATRTVNVGPRFDFGPKTLTINRNDTVRFRWTGRLPHNVRITSGPRSGSRTISRLRRRGTVRRTFTRAGTYRLVCDIHAPRMRMTIRVR